MNPVLGPARRAIPLAAALASLAGTASAEVELSFYTGAQSAPHSDVRHSEHGKEHVKWEGKSTAMPPYWGLRATWWETANWGWGVEMNHAKVYSDKPSKYGYRTLEFTDGLNIVTVNGWYRWKDAARRWTPYVGAGIGVSIPHVEVEYKGDPLTLEYQLTGPAVQAVAGISYEINDRWAVFGEYKGTYSENEADLKGGGTLRTDIITNALNIGVSWRF